MSKQILLAIDPGPIKSAFVWMEGTTILEAGIRENEEMFSFEDGLRYPDISHVAIEMVASYGMPVGKDVFETVLWIGRFIELAAQIPVEFTKVYRKDVKIHLCGSMKAKDSNIRQALIDRYGGPGAAGTKKQPGPLYGISKDMWSALAVGLTWMDHQTEAANCNA